MLDYIINNLPVDLKSYIVINGVTFHYINRTKVAMLLGVQPQTVSIDLKFLKNLGLIHYFFDYVDKKLYVAPIIDECNKYLAPANKTKISLTKKEVKMLFEIDGERKFSSKSEDFICSILKHYKDLFCTRIPSNGKITQSFTKACQFIDDLYNGMVVDSKIHPTINSLNSSNSKFYIDGWKEELRLCTGNWEYLIDLVLNNIKNYKLMQDSNRMPIKKSSLPKGIDVWFEDTYTNNSYFIYCMNEPPYIISKDDDKLADEIYDSLPTTVQNAGNDIFDLIPTKVLSYPFWKNIKNMYEWGKALCRLDKYAYYWLDSADDIVNKFYNYIKENNLSVSVSTVNIKKSIAVNAPWVWFVLEAVKKHTLNEKIVQCATVEELEELYEA